MTKRGWALLGLLCLGPALAHEESDHGRAYRLRQQATILPLDVILERLPLAAESRVLEIEEESEHGRHLYEIELLGPDGRVRKIKVDATNGDLIGEEHD